jgi:DHA3 family macrolide efflux protein-like MFS transporter
MQASTTLMVPEKHLSRVAGLNQMLSGAAGIVSPPLGALLLETLPMQSVLAIDVGTALFAIALLFLVHVPQPARQETTTTAKPSVLADLREGLRFVWAWPGLLLLLAVATLLNMLITPAFSLLPIMVTQHFEGAAPELAALQSAFGISLVIGGITLGMWGGFKRRIVTAMLAVTLMGVGITAFGLIPAHAFALAVVALSFIGFMNPIANGSFMAVMQTTVPPEMQGRIFTLMMSGSTAMSPLGLAVAGPVADALSAQVWFLIGGIVTIVMGVGCFFVPAIMSIENRAIQNARQSQEPNL